ncbi:nitroreductase/quinone reductase family protein [Streptomyces sp. NPDC101225]|uniref:nitroreductase family deazaflavin-dependent oxidoreductase n=1 Tax=Streptomyces sp. NPDC101225 TaxID=3366135 RepID=UPI0037F67269
MIGERAVQRLSSTRGFAKVAPHVVPVLDRAVHRLTRGRVLPSARMLPGAILTSTGARSGLARRTPLACMPEEGGRSWILVGSNFGRADHPAWTHNLLAHPDAGIDWKGTEIPVRARLLRGEERARAWRSVLTFWPPYATYQRRVARELRVFRLTRRPS